MPDEVVQSKAIPRGMDGRDQAGPPRGTLVRGEEHRGVPEKGETTAPGGSRPKVKGKGQKGAREMVASHIAGPTNRETK